MHQNNVQLGRKCFDRMEDMIRRQGKTVLVQLSDATDPETGERYTVKCYESDPEGYVRVVGTFFSDHLTP